MKKSKRSWSDTKETLSEFFAPTIKVVVVVGTIIGTVLFFRWASYKGAISFVIGMGVMAYLLLSKNMMLRWFIDLTDSNIYLDELGGFKHEEEEDETEEDSRRTQEGIGGARS